MKLAWSEEPPEVIVARIGERVRVPCVARGDSAQSVEWFKTSKNNESLGPKLQFYSIQQSDAGLYKCIASNNADEHLSKEVKIEVLGKYNQPSNLLIVTM